MTRKEGVGDKKLETMSGKWKAFERGSKDVDGCVWVCVWYDEAFG